jgi:hypothetical protein
MTRFTALTDNNMLVSFNTSNPSHAHTISVTGIEGTLLGIDTRPADGLLYGLTTANRLYTLNPMSGEATFVSTLSQPFMGGVISGFDFNPVPDRLRLVGDNDQNFRINVDTGEVIEDGRLAFAAGDRNAGVNPNITASAYINAFDGATSTALYNIDTLLNTLVLQDPPNDGTLVTIGELGVDFGLAGGFDIVSSPDGTNQGFAVSDARLYSIDLETGMATDLGMIGGEARLNLLGLAATPEPTMEPITFVALTSNNQLLAFNPETPEHIASIPVRGIDGVLLGIDTRPADGMLYGLTTANKLYTLDPNGFDSGTFNGSFTLADDEVSLLLDSALYINLHTEMFNAGELRGQVEVELENDIVAFGIPIEGSQEVGDMIPGEDAPAMGTFDVIYDDATNTLRIRGSFMDLTGDLLPVGPEDVEGNPQSAIHLHQGAVGENGPILRNLTVNADGTFEGTFTLTDEEEALLLDQALYVNIHTETFGAGELRGQLAVEVENDVVILGIPIEERQEVGDMVPPDGPANGMFDLIFDNSTQKLKINGSFADLTSPLFPVGPAMDVEGNPQSAVHLHQGMAGENGPIVRSLATMDHVATFVSTLSQPFEGGVISGFDFNPVPDRLRLVGDNNQNFRINVDTGEVIADGDLAFAEGDVNAGVNPNITASAYTNSFAGATSTALYNIDTLLNTLVLQNPPNDGTLVTVGELGVDFGLAGGFDIVSSPDGTNQAFAVSDAILYSIDLETGAATKLGMIGQEPGLDLLGFSAVSRPVRRMMMADSVTGEMPETGMGHDMGMDMEHSMMGRSYAQRDLRKQKRALTKQVSAFLKKTDLADLTSGLQQMGLSSLDQTFLEDLNTMLPKENLGVAANLFHAHLLGSAAA